VCACKIRGGRKVSSKRRMGEGGGGREREKKKKKKVKDNRQV
jgi:hypothetical protein